MRNKKAQLQISFGWLFAIIAGGFILFLAIYAATKFVDLGQTQQAAETGEEIGVLLNPLETSFETGKSTSFSISVDTRIYNRCDDYGNFGNQIIKTSQKSFGEWTETDIENDFSNKYIFSQSPIEGKVFYVFSKPFEFPFKVSDLIYLTSSEDKYCFADAPEDIEEEISNLNQANLFVGNCSGNYIEVCFEDSNCDINVDYSRGYVKKEGGVVYFETDALMYAGIFGDADVYECQVQRLMQRVGSLAELYSDKATLLSSKGCSSNLNLAELRSAAASLGSSSQLNSVSEIAEEIGDANDVADCKLW